MSDPNKDWPLDLHGRAELTSTLSKLAKELSPKDGARVFSAILIASTVEALIAELSCVGEEVSNIAKRSFRV